LNNTYNDAKYLLAAVIIAVSLFLASYGMQWAWYIGIAYLGFNAGIMMLASGVLMNPDLFTRPANSVDRPYRNPSIQFLVQVLTALFLYALYNAGFVFTSGFFAFMLGMSTMSNILVALVATKGES